MSPDHINLGDTWSVLATGMRTDPGIQAVPTGVSTMAGPILIGLDNDRRRHVLVPLAQGEQIAEDRRGTAMQIWIVEREGHTFASAVCVDRGSEDIFLRFAEDVLGDLRDSSEGGSAFLRLVSRWRRLFGRGRDELLGPEQLAGIVGELLQLRRLVKLAGQAALAFWTGPRGEPHDFTGLCGDLEVKATLTRNGRRVSVNGVQQLDSRPDTSLALVHYALSRTPDGQSVPDMLSELESDGCSRLELLEALAGFGYRAGDERSYQDIRFEVRERRAYDVIGESFPRIIATSFADGVLPPGIAELGYVIDLTNEPPVPLTDSELEQFELRVVRP